MSAILKGRIFVLILALFLVSVTTGLVYDLVAWVVAAVRG